MAMDVVHDTQMGYRTILHCMSRPGTIENVREIADKVTMPIECLPATFVTSLTLLDREVTFTVVGGDTQKIKELFIAYTMATSASLQTADYVFITKQASEEQISSVFQNVKTGTLINPQQSATIILEAEYLSSAGNLVLTGPGIEAVEEVSIGNYDHWLEARNNVNSEYPLGVDMILLDELAHVMCLPRTTVTKIREV